MTATMDPASQPRHDGDGHEHQDDTEERHAPPAEEEHAPPREPFGRRARRWRRAHPLGTIAIFLVLIALIVGGVLLGWYFHTHESTDDAQIDAHIAPISSRVVGTVTGVFVDNNQRVERGQLLAQLDPRDYQVAVARAEAELAQARAQLEAEHPSVPITATTNVTQIATAGDEVERARAAIAGAERDYQSALARIHATQANAERANADEARYKYLLAQRAIPVERYDQVDRDGQGRARRRRLGARPRPRGAEVGRGGQGAALAGAQPPGRGQPQRAAPAQHPRGQHRRQGGRGQGGRGRGRARQARPVVHQDRRAAGGHRRPALGRARPARAAGRGAVVDRRSRSCLGDRELQGDPAPSPQDRAEGRA